MLVSASDWLKLIFEKVCGFAYIKITLSTNLDMQKRFQGSFCCDLPLQVERISHDLFGMRLKENLLKKSAKSQWEMREISPIS